MQECGLVVIKCKKWPLLVDLGLYSHVFEFIPFLNKIVSTQTSPIYDMLNNESEPTASSFVPNGAPHK